MVNRELISRLRRAVRGRLQHSFGHAALAAFLALLLAAAPPSVGAQEGETVSPAVRDVTPPGILPGPEVDGPLTREAVPPPPADPARWHRFHLPETLDAATFKVRNRVIHISGVRAPELEQACVSAEGDWPCGRSARHSLRMFLRGRSVECYFPRADGVSEITAPCRVGSTDLGMWLLQLGWALTDDLATDSYRAAEQEARCSRSGIWRGVEPPDNCPTSG